MVWSFRMNITNGTDRELTVSAPDLKWGIWYTDGVDKRKPVSIPPGKTKYALGIRASKGTATGYECDCTWLDQSAHSYGSISLYIDVPYTADNKSDFHTSGVFRGDGWQPLPKRGHNFTRNVTITEAFGALQVSEDTLSVEDDDPEYLALVAAELSASATMEDWADLQHLDVVDQFDPVTAMPDTYKLPPKEQFIGRGEVIEIDKRDWAGLSDPKLPNAYAKQLRADRYFAVPVYSINTNTRATEVVPAGVRKTTMRAAEVTSTIRSVLETHVSIGTSLEASAEDKLAGQRVAAKLESAFSIQNVREASTTHIVREETKIEIEPVDYDRVFVPWVFSTTVALYCQNKDGDVRLVAISQWAMEQLFRTYKTSASALSDAA